MKPHITFKNKNYTLTQIDENTYHWHFNAIELLLKDYLTVYNYAVERYKKNNDKVNLIITHDLTFSFASET